MKIFLFVIMLGSGHGSYRESHEMPSWEQCFASLHSMVQRTPDSEDNEGTFVAYCATEPKQSNVMELFSYGE